MEKENYTTPVSGILKAHQLAKSESHQIPLNGESNISRTSLRRRVSFAPEVTLHKIDFIPQYRSDSFEQDADVDVSSDNTKTQNAREKRRETIGMFPGGSRQQPEANGDVRDVPTQNDLDVNQQYDEREDFGVQVLEDSSDLEVLSDADSDSAPIQSAIPITVEDEELTMEITAPVGGIIDRETSQVSKFSENKSESVPVELSSSEDEIEFTENVGKALAQVVQVGDISDDEEVGEMELTQSMGNIPQYLVASPKLADHIEATQPSDSTHKSQQVETTYSVYSGSNEHIPHSEHNEDDGMDFTQSVSKIQTAETKETETQPEVSIVYDDSLNELFEEKTMELTQQVSRIQANVIQLPILQQFPEEDQSEELELPKVLDHRITEQLTTKETEESIEMEFTQVMSVQVKPRSEPIVVLSQMETNPDSKQLQSEEESEMDLTHQVGDLTLKRKYSSLIQNGEQPEKDGNSQEDRAAKMPKPSSLTSTFSPIVVNRTTTTIPLADITNDSIDEETSGIFTNLVPLSQFLKDIGIVFYDDLEIGSQSQNRLSISLPKTDEENFELRDYVLGNIQIPIYELNEFSCKELIQNIEEGIKIFETINESTSSMNPRLFKEFYELPEAQASMKSEFQLIKDFSRQEANKVWYGWRSQLILNVIEELRKTIENLNADKQKLLLAIEQIDEANSIVLSKYKKIKDRLGNFKKIIALCGKVNEDEIRLIKTEIKQVYEHIQQFKREINEQTAKVTQLNEKILKNQKEINRLTQDIKINESVIQRNKKYDSDEIYLLAFKFQMLQSFTKFKFCKIENKSKMLIEFDSVLSIYCDFKANSISYEIITASKPSGFKIPELFEVYSRSIINNLTDSKLLIPSQLANLRKYWSNLKKLDKYLYKVSLKFPLKITKTDQENERISIKYFKPEFKCKFELKFSIDLEKLRIENFTVVVLRMGQLIDTRKIVNAFQRDCSNNELIKEIGPVSYNTDNAS